MKTAKAKLQEMSYNIETVKASIIVTQQSEYCHKKSVQMSWKIYLAASFIGTTSLATGEDRIGELWRAAVVANSTRLQSLEYKMLNGACTRIRLQHR